MLRTKGIKGRRCLPGRALLGLYDLGTERNDSWGLQRYLGCRLTRAQATARAAYRRRAADTALAGVQERLSRQLSHRAREIMRRLSARALEIPLDEAARRYHSHPKPTFKTPWRGGRRSGADGDRPFSYIDATHLKSTCRLSGVMAVSRLAGTAGWVAAGGGSCRLLCRSAPRVVLSTLGLLMRRQRRRVGRRAVASSGP